ATHKIAIALPCRAATFVDRPDHQALTASAVTRSKDSRNISRRLSVRGFGSGTGIALNAELRQHCVLGTEKAQREQNQVGGQHSIRARNALRYETDLLIARPFHVVDVEHVQ